jgi:ribonuclease R
MGDINTRCQRIVRQVELGDGAPGLEVVFEAPGVAPRPAPEAPWLGAGAFLALGPDGWEPLASPGTARAALYEILARYGLNPLFSEAARREVAAWEAAPGIDDPALEDLTALPFVTIDNEDSRDLDQAMCLERAEGGGYVVWYALADASSYVRAGSALFDEAVRRGSTYYLPGVNVPMLPRELSEGLVSLNPRVARRALVFRMHLCARCEEVDTQIMQARIVSRAKLSYPGVQEMFDHPEGNPLMGQEFTETLLLLREVGQRRIEEANRRDVVRYDLARIGVQIGAGEEGAAGFSVGVEARLEVERWNEQLSLLCNGEGALFLKDGLIDHPHVQPIFRVHEAPEARDLGGIQETLGRLLAAHGLEGDGAWSWRPEAGQSVAEYLGALPRDPSRERLREAIERMFMMVNQRSSFSEEPGLHFALGVRPYSRFSAPMREVVGIFTHKEALEKLHPARATQSAAADEALREAVIAAANTARGLQRKLTKEVQELALDGLLSGDLARPLAERPARRGTICGMRASRLYVRLDDPPMELKVYTEDLERALGVKYALAEGGVALAPAGEGPALRMGDEVVLRVVGREGERWALAPIS